ncbi:MAG: Asp23/Gls24 family envelope stress response protein [Bacillota bacterium]|nr:Asp23/Gls24 family envelope stress response protein [Bacillota bacterium]
MSEMVNKETRKDKVRISDEVIGIIAGIAAADVENVTSLSGGFVDGIAGILGRKNLGKGVKVQSNDREVIIDISIVVEYGCKIHMVAQKIQDRVREAVQNMTDLNVSEVDVNVVGVNVDEVKKD